MSKKLLLSIITVNLNNIEGLEKTMNSVFEQTYNDFEYIIIDGGSTDGSSEYIESHSDKIDFWVSEKDSGIYNAMNKGIKKAKGKYLQFLNSGDWLAHKTTISNIIGHISNSDIVYGNMIKVFPNGDEKQDKGPAANDLSLRNFIEGTLNHSSSFINAELFKRYGLYDENLKIVSDWKFFLIALGLNNSRTKYIDCDIVYFDMDGISNNNMSLIELERGEVIKKVIPIPIYIDYIELKKQNIYLNTNRFKLFAEVEKHPFLRKVNSICFQLFLKVFK